MLASSTSRTPSGIWPGHSFYLQRRERPVGSLSWIAAPPNGLSLFQEISFVAPPSVFLVPTQLSGALWSRPHGEARISHIVANGLLEIHSSRNISGIQACEPLLNSSTASLRRMQNKSTAASHVSLQKWATQLGIRIPDTIWLDTWIPFRSAKENTFLGRLPTDPSQRLHGASRISHIRTRRPTAPVVISIFVRMCFTAYGNARLISFSCWRWCSSFMARAAESTAFQLCPTHVLVAEALPCAWNVPFKLWHISGAALNLLAHLEG